MFDLYFDVTTVYKKPITFFVHIDCYGLPIVLCCFTMRYGFILRHYFYEIDFCYYISEISYDHIFCPYFRQLLPEGSRVIRVMPNTPAIVQSGASVFAAGSNIDTEDTGSYPLLN